MSVYQTNGRPLSQQALYQQKLRQGVYNNPGKPSVGVSSNASDTAALLAASSDLTVKPSFERPQPAADAQTAALAAKVAEKPSWKREKTDPYADAAAASAKVNPAGPTKLVLGLPDDYNGAASANSAYSLAQSNSTYSMTNRSTPEKLVSKHGLVSKQTAPETPLNIAKITQLASQNSSLLIDKRFNPEQDYRSGINSSKSDSSNGDAGALEAANSVSDMMKHGSGHTDFVASQKRTQSFQASQVVDAHLLSVATAKANERLSSISQASSQELKQQAQVYSKALTAAQKNSEARLSSYKSGMVDLGGGLSLPISEVDKLANLIVQPVLADLDSKAVAQREYDANQKRKHVELTEIHQKSKQEDEERKLAEQAQREKENEERIAAHEQEKAAEEQKLAEFESEQRGIVAEKQNELDAIKDQHVEEQEALLQEKAENEARIQEEESTLIAKRKEELETMQAEKDELLKPVNEELELETAKLKELTSERDAVKEEHDEIQKLNDERVAKIEELKRKLEEANQGIEEHNALLTELVPKREALDNELGELERTSETQLADSEKTKNDLDKELKDLEQQKKDNTSTKAKYKKDILSAHDERVVDAHKINSELPEHLQEQINDNKLLDTGSLFSVEAPKSSPTPVKASEIKQRKSFRQKLSGMKLSLLPSSKGAAA